MHVLDYKTQLTFRYIFALCLIGCILIFTYVFLIKEAKNNRQDAYIINISGKQRMLTQRIALFSREVYHAENKKDATLYLAKLEKSLAIMAQDHKALISPFHPNGEQRPLSDEIYKLYNASDGVNRRMNIYIEEVKEFITAYEQSEASDQQKKQSHD